MTDAPAISDRVRDHLRAPCSCLIHYAQDRALERCPDDEGLHAAANAAAPFSQERQVAWETYWKHLAEARLRASWGRWA